MRLLYSVMLILLSSVFIFAGCKKEAVDQNVQVLAPVTVEFDHIADGQHLLLNAVSYINASGEQFTVNLLQYFISNIQLRKADGTVYTVDQDSSYFLIKEGDPSSRVARFKAPPGDYNQLTFVLGVDSLRNTMDVSRRTGVLDPSSGHDGMYWGWNSGYIFFKMEGTSPAAPVDPTGVRKFRYHIGGFGGYSAPTLNNIKTITIDLTAAGIAQVRKGKTANIHLMVDIMKVFNGPARLSIEAHPMVMFSTYSQTIANNYQSIFFHDHTEN